MSHLTNTHTYIYTYTCTYTTYTHIYIVTRRSSHRDATIPILGFLSENRTSPDRLFFVLGIHIHETWPYYWHGARAQMSKLHFSVYFGLCETYTYCYWWKTTLSVDVQRGTCKDQVLPVFFSDHFCTTSYHRFLSPLRLIARSKEVSKPRDFIYNRPIALIFGRHLGSTAAEVPVKFQSDAIIKTTNLAASRLHEILR